MSDVSGKPPQNIVNIAIEASLQSPCQSKRGAVIFVGEIAVGTGFNHKPDGFECDGSDACKVNCAKDAIHAEQAAILAVGHPIGMEMLHVKTVDGELVHSGPPSCLQCSKLIIPAGIEWMWLYHESGWRAYDAVEFHRLSGAYVPGYKQ